MKKILVCAVAILALLAMVGCAKQDAIQEKESLQQDALKEETGNLKVSNVYSGGDCEAVGENAYLLQGNPDGSYNIHVVDVKAKIKTVLCSNLSCTHASDVCNSWVPNAVGGCNVAVDDTLYLFIRGYGEGGKLPTVYKMALDGSEKTKIVEFGANQTITVPAAFDEKYIYLTLETAEEKEGRIEVKYELIKIDKATGETSVIYKYSSQANFLIGTIDNKFVMKKIDGAMQEIYLLNRAGEVEKSIFSYNRGDKLEVVTNGLKVVDLQAKSMLAVDETDSLSPLAENLDIVINPKAFYIRNVSDFAVIVETTIQNPENYATKTYRYAMDFNSGETKPVNITYDYYKEPKHVTILAEVQGYYLIISDIKIEKQQFTDQSGKIFTDAVEVNQYSLISVENYSNNIANLIAIETV